MKKAKIPKTDSIKELANFFQTHELADFEDELVEVREPVFVRRTGLRIHLEPHELKEIKELAEAQGVPQDELVRGWVLQHLAPRNGGGSGHRRMASKGRK